MNGVSRWSPDAQGRERAGRHEEHDDTWCGDVGPAGGRQGEQGDDALIGVLVIDDHPAVIEGLRMLVESAPDLTLVGVAIDGESALNRFEATNPDVVLMDYGLPDTDGISLTRALKDIRPEVRVLLLTAVDDESVAERAIRRGCDGFLTKTATPARILNTVRRVGAGEACFDVALLVRAVRDQASELSTTDLSRRELDVLRQLAQGATTEVIAAELYVSVNTVRSYVRRILEKLGAHSKLEAVAMAVRDGVLIVDDFFVDR